MDEKEELIQKHIFQYLFSEGEFKFEYNQIGFNLYLKIGRLIEKELENGLVQISNIENVINRLIEEKIILKKYDENSTQNGIITLVNSPTIQEYAIEKGYITTKVLIDYINRKYSKTIDMFLLQFKRIQGLDKDLEFQKKELSDKIVEQDKRISNFNNNILSIMAILIAAFAIIGFNIGGIKFIVSSAEVLHPWEYAGSIGVVNLCIVLSLFFLFFLLNKIVNPHILISKEQKVLNTNEKPNKRFFNFINGISLFSNKFAIILIILFISLIVICFIIA